MHKSRLSTFIIDCRTGDVAEAARFWSAALGREAKPSNEPDYRDLAASPGEPLLMVQKVDHESRIHLDIESDDLEAEARRLEALGPGIISRCEVRSADDPRPVNYLREA